MADDVAQDALPRFREKWAAVLRFWRGYVLRYRWGWAICWLLQLGFFSISAVLPFLFRRVINALEARDLALFIPAIGIFLGVELLQVIQLYARGYAMRHLELRVEQDLQRAMYRKHHTAPFLKMSQVDVGDALQRLTDDVPRCRSLIVSSASELVGHLVLVAIVLSLMFVMAPLLAGIALAFAAVYAVGYKLYQDRAPRLARRRQEARSDYLSAAEEGLDALYSVRVQGAYRQVMWRFTRVLVRYLREGFGLYKLDLKFRGGFTTLITMLSEVAIISMGAWLIFQGMTTLGTLIAYTQYIHWLYVFVNFMTSFAMEVEPALVSLSRVEEVLSLPEDWVVETIAAPRRSLDHPCAAEIRRLDFTVGDSHLFDSLDLEIPRGKITGIWGRSGVGKSTLLNLLLGLYKPPRGTVHLFGHDVTELSPEEVLALVSVVEQEPRFFGGNIQEMMGLLEQEGKLERFRKLAAQLGMSEFVERLEARHLSSAKLTELSGGERKRLGILRGLLRDAPLVVLDEPTAFLDKATATTIMRNLKDRLRDKTIVVFSHDPLVRQYCDEVIELE